MYKIVEIVVNNGDSLFLPYFKGKLDTIYYESPISKDGYNLIKFDDIEYGSFELAKHNINEHKMLYGNLIPDNEIQYIIHDI